MSAFSVILKANVDRESEEDKDRYEEYFIEDGMMPDFIPSAMLNSFVFNEKTVDAVLQKFYQALSAVSRHLCPVHHL